MRPSIRRLSLAVGTSFIAATAVLAQETTTYTYDALGRLKGSAISGGTNDGRNTGTCFDPAGNRTKYDITTAAAPGTCVPGPAPTPTPTPTPTNQPPVAVADTTSFVCSLYKTVDLVSNDTDPENNLPLHLVSVTSASPDFFWATSTTSTSVTVGASGAGTYILTYVVADSLGATSTGTLTATVTGTVNCKQPPLE